MRRAERWSLVGLLDLLVIVDAVVVCAIAVKGIHTGTLRNDLAAIICLVAVGVAMGYWARSTERHLRPGHQRAASAPAPRRPPDRPVQLIFAVLILGGFLYATPSWIGQSWTNWRRSVETQDHGLPSTLTVERVIHAYHATNHAGHYYTLYLQGELDPPVAGSTQTTLYLPRNAKYSGQAQVPVLVDPRDPGYAERAGSAVSTAASAIVTIVIASSCDLFMGFIVVCLVVGRRRSRN